MCCESNTCDILGNFLSSIFLGARNTVLHKLALLLSSGQVIKSKLLGALGRGTVLGLIQLHVHITFMNVSVSLLCIQGSSP
jgi:hypothetical protein